MKLVKTRTRYRCDFCARTSTRAAMEAHERMCWRNPDRHCPSCNNTGFYPRESWEPEEPCYYCSKRDPDLLGWTKQ